MANTKDYPMREMILDQCLSTGKEYTREELQEIVNKRLAERDMMPIRSRSTILQDIQEMNEKFYQLYGSYGIVYEDRHRKRYYHYREGIESIYNRELSSEDIEKLQEVRSLLQGFRGMPQFDWLDEMSVRFDQNMMGRQREIASFGTLGTGPCLVWVYHHPADHLPVGTRDGESGGGVYQNGMQDHPDGCRRSPTPDEV